LIGADFGFIAGVEEPEGLEELPDETVRVLDRR